MVATRSAEAAPLTIFCSSSGTELSLCHQAVQTWTAKTGQEVRVIALPSDWGTVLPLYRQLLPAAHPAADILILDSTWIGTLAPLLLDIPPADDDRGIQPGLFQVGGRRVALPWYRDIGLLFYRRDLLERYHMPVPTHWDELERTAAFIQSAERQAGRPVWGYVWQGRTTESLVCNVLEWDASENPVEADGTVKNSLPGLQHALMRAAHWVGTVSPPGVLNYDEENARGIFQSGQAVFMRNWVYAWALANNPDSPVSGKIGVAPLPRDATSSATGMDGTVYLGIARNTEHAAEALSLLRFLTSGSTERHQALAGGYIPARTDLLDDPEVRRAIPILDTIRPALSSLELRPVAQTGVDYPRVSWMMANRFKDVLRTPGVTQQALTELVSDLQRLALLGQWSRQSPFRSSSSSLIERQQP
ncbi:extracellular solute-binding protein [Gluconobacter kanchanaburiensis]|uniref:Sugar ABC transporter substrate-binding protein n=1 Tax=Gluconobacter kanchanaburiensis NBRC 103587 TaxID=1307948 RepID=A0A511BA12_9PROT|nr:extracellular solute-binding protein [Gluconobacter kanchanaburiensis]MBF0862933.1 extracellular solute-binding protein [Gluconobacter kanchanaburiensis]GBR69128.1 sugar ABC transporter substrate-binding protein [Gluconobacter kanchanaburiensis NBRC 103587]GEK97259.1 sugar ABC transporter substrate-binding protein [Gluconobacter kanchanaburiensis NBRC 103587]